MMHMDKISTYGMMITVFQLLIFLPLVSTTIDKTKLSGAIWEKNVSSDVCSIALHSSYYPILFNRQFFNYHLESFSQDIQAKISSCILPFCEMVHW